MVAVVRVACALRTGDLAKTHAFWIDEYNIIYIYIYIYLPNMNPNQTDLTDLTSGN